MKAGIGNIMKQAQKMQENVQKAQEAIAAMEVVGESGGGLVKVILTGQHEVRRIHLDASLKEEELDFVGDLVAAAMNDANARLAEAAKAHMAEATAGMNLPPGIKLPF